MVDKWCVVTTINPESLDVFLEQAAPQAKVVVVGDKKNEAEIAGVCLAHAVTHLTVQVQQDLFPDYPGPWYSETRRNVGYLWLLQNAEPNDICIIQDDDNIPVSGWADRHEDNLNHPGRVTFVTNTEWFNPCELIDGPAHYMRGYPPHARLNAKRPTYEQTTGATQVSMGLWHGVPDVDAMTHLSVPHLRSCGMRYESMILDESVWCPINTQNTALRVKHLPLFPCVPGIPRYGDIFGGYILQALLRPRTYVGRPVVEHKRHPHNFQTDLRHEHRGFLSLDVITQQLRTECEWPAIIDIFQEAQMGITPFLRWWSDHVGM